jgi:hypothetical protein
MWEEMMRVRFVQSGGVVQGARGCELDSTALAPAVAHELEALVAASGIVESGAFLTRHARDLRTYDIVVQHDDGSTLEVTFDDLTLPAPARALVGFLRRHSAPRARS